MQVAKSKGLYLVTILDEAKKLAERHGWVLRVDPEDVVLAKTDEWGVTLVLKTGLTVRVKTEQAARDIFSGPLVDYYFSADVTGCD